VLVALGGALICFSSARKRRKTLRAPSDELPDDDQWLDEDCRDARTASLAGKRNFRPARKVSSDESSSMLPVHQRAQQELQNVPKAKRPYV